MATLSEQNLRNIGFNDPNVIKGILSDPGQVQRYERELGLGGASQIPGQTSGFSTPTTTGTFNPIDVARQFSQFQQEAAKPAVEGLKAQREPLKARYQSLLDELTRREEVQTQETETSLSREFGRRGVPLSSGIFDQALTEARRPISEQFISQRAQTGAAREQDLASLAAQIGQLQAGQPSSAVSSALSYINQLQNSQRLQEQAAEQRRQFGITEARLSQPTTSSPNLEFRTETDALGNQRTVVYDRKTGKKVSPGGEVSTGDDFSGENIFPVNGQSSQPQSFDEQPGLIQKGISELRKILGF